MATGLTERQRRAAMLRVLALYDPPAATDGVLRGLADPARRVREVAIRAAQPHHLHVPAATVAALFGQTAPD